MDLGGLLLELWWNSLPRWQKTLIRPVDLRWPSGRLEVEEHPV